MSQIDGLKLVKSKIDKFSFVRFNIVHKLEFFETESNDKKVDSNLELILGSDGSDTPHCVKVRLTNVRQLSVENFGGGQTRIIGIDFIDISDRQWERINWEFVDYEDGVIHCYAESVSIELV